MGDNSITTELEAWYVDQCDGLWEHGLGIRIDTLDNPGWVVKIDLKNPSSIVLQWKGVELVVSEDDWIICGVEEEKYVGRGDASKLGAILTIFLALIKKG